MPRRLPTHECPAEIMVPPARLDAALKRLSTALDQLEAAGERLAAVGSEKRDLADTLAVMQDDRGRLAQELDTALTQTHLFEQATDEVAIRLGQAGGLIRNILATAEAAQAPADD